MFAKNAVTILYLPLVAFLVTLPLTIVQLKLILYALIVPLDIMQIPTVQFVIRLLEIV